MCANVDITYDVHRIFHPVFLPLNKLQFVYNSLQERYDKAKHYFEMALSTHDDWQAMFQLGVMYYDGIGCEPDPVGIVFILRVPNY